MAEFTHLHVHSQYSILDGAASIKALIEKAKNDGMTAIAITDHGNMYGALEFHGAANKAGIKPIIGCEVYVAPESRFIKKGVENLRNYNHLILLAKNKIGYHNLARLVSMGFAEGFYYKPRIDKEILKQFSEGIIASSACIAGEIPQYILHQELDKAEKAILEYKEIFGEDFYLEVQRHQTMDPEADREVFLRQTEANQHLIEFSKKLGVKLIATNDVHFVNSEDALAHDILLCLNTGTDVTNQSRMRYSRQEWFKTTAEMKSIFADLPEALANTMEIAEKVENYKVASDAIMPDFPLPDGFTNADDYLRHLTLEGAKIRYGELTPDVQERLDFELETIKRMGFPGYFLIVWDFIAAARNIGVSVGPGRGSAAGSAVAYCLKITDIDPIKYELLFERFLNPDRISMPDIDIDFDNEGREKVLSYVNDKYGKERVAHIITFGSMAAKMAIRDVARVQKLPLHESDRLAKLVPDGPKISLSKAYSEVKELSDARKSSDPLVVNTLKYAEKLEGSVRNTGVHACGIIIGRDDLINYIPLCTTKDSDGKDLLVTQYEGNHMEYVGLLKMDFLGLKNLSIIRNAIELIEKNKGFKIDINNVPLDDAKTYELYSRGDTVGTFQFESDGMRKYLRELKPNRFEDLIAMNALYRPGPMQYIPQFINRKHGREPIAYDLPEMEKRLKETYGITVYQEQVMLLARDLAGFTPGESDLLRKAMGKKQRETMDKLKLKFIEGCAKKGYKEEIVKKIWSDWESFAEYAFNKSHSTCYSYIAYQTAYLKANYPGEYMAALLNYSPNIDDITKYMNEARRMGVNVLGPDVNESFLKFAVNKRGDIRFGLNAIKGVGENAVRYIIEEREKNGQFSDAYNFVERVNLNAVNKKNIEALAYSGALDTFSEYKRACYFAPDDKGTTFTENLIRYGNKFQSDKINTGQSLFGMSVNVEMNKPQVPTYTAWNKLEELGHEKNVIGIYLSAHPLDPYRFELESLCTHSLDQLKDIGQMRGKEVVFGGMLTSVRHAMSKTNKPFGSFAVEDFSDQLRLNLFGNDYIKFKNILAEGYCVMINARIDKRYNSETENEIKITQICLLSEVKDNMVKSLSLTIPIKIINDTLIDSLAENIETKDGKVTLKFIISDPESNTKINMFSRTQRIKLTSKFIDFIHAYDDIVMKIN